MMNFVSYAQNFEDVMLWRALKQVDQGFYIDVGAWSAEEHSVTHAFYERGWHGINIEPNAIFHEELEKKRLRDINLRLAVSDHDAEMTMNIIDDTGLSTLDDTIASEHQQNGFAVRKEQVQVTRLAVIWQQYIAKEQPVHFLKVDVEGLEEAVLRGMDWSQHRPWIVVVEATLPLTQVVSYKAWEQTLTAADYGFAYADGLNRFYVAKEHARLQQALKCPPNFWDDFKLAAQVSAEARAQQAMTETAQANERSQQAEARTKEAEANAVQAEATAQDAWLQYQMVINSRSWRITYPLRLSMAWVKWLVRGSLAWITRKPGSRPRRIGSSALLHLRNWVLLRPHIKIRVLSFLRYFYRFKAWLMTFKQSLLPDDMPKQHFQHTRNKPNCDFKALLKEAVALWR